MPFIDSKVSVKVTKERAAAIEYMADTVRVGEGRLLTDPMPERDKVTAGMAQYYMDEMGDGRPDAERTAEEFVRSIEDYSEIIGTCFYDTDYMFLDDYSPEDIVMSGTDDESGMGVMEPARKRLPDGTLEYIGKPMEKEHFTIKLKL